MRLADKRFGKFEAMMMLCGLLLFGMLCVILIPTRCNFVNLILLLFALCLNFTVCGIPTWLLYKGNSWLKLAGYLYLISILIVVVPMFVFLYDWDISTANMRPEGLSPNEGKYLTANEFVTIFCVIWSIILIIPVLITSYLTKRWVMKEDILHKQIIESAHSAVKVNVQPIRNVLQELYSNNITEDEAHELMSQIMCDIECGHYDQFRLVENRVDLATAYGMNNYEWTAYCQGAPLLVIAQWRYNGWPDKCCITNEPLDYIKYHWLVKEYAPEKYGLMKLT